MNGLKKVSYYFKLLNNPIRWTFNDGSVIGYYNGLRNLISNQLGIYEV